jgi:hypothetical protein
VLKNEDYSSKKKGKGQLIDKSKNIELIARLNRYSETKVSVPRIKRGSRQELETLINEEALPLARYLRNEVKDWNPRIVELSSSD